jgi:4'-phosphopantetheinyl transferase EntD
MIEEILPVVVASADTVDDLLDEPLFAPEVASIAKAVEKRRREFTTVRACARRALAALGVERQPLVPGERGAPAWPPGVVGSMTHCAGYRAAAVAWSADVAALGVDAEPHGPLPHGVLDVVTDPAERDRLAALARQDPSVHWDRLLFSAKESIYKAWFPLTFRWLGFEEAELVIHPARRTFIGHLRTCGPSVGGHRLRALHGRWTVRDGLVVTAVAITRDRQYS